MYKLGNHSEMRINRNIQIYLSPIINLNTHQKWNPGCWIHVEYQGTGIKHGNRKSWSWCDLKCWNMNNHLRMGVSINGGTPKWMLYKGKSYQNGWFGGPPIYGNTHIFFIRISCCGVRLPHLKYAIEVCLSFTGQQPCSYLQMFGCHYLPFCVLLKQKNIF